MKQIRIEGQMICKSPLQHGGNEKTGSAIGFRRIDMITNNGIEEVPFLEGNAIRGKLRRLIMRDFLTNIGYEPKEPRIYHFFYSGGNLEKVSNDSDIGTINLELRRIIREFIPAISLFGGALLNQMFVGKLKVMKAYPICSELAGIFFKHDKEKKYYSFHELISNTFQTRKDDLRVGSEEGKNAQQMLIEQEVLIPGTKLTHSFVLEDTNKIEESCFAHLLNLWKKSPFVGASSSIGSGELILNYEYVLPSPDFYLDFLKEKKEDIIKIIKKLDQPIIKKRKKKKDKDN